MLGVITFSEPLYKYVNSVFQVFSFFYPYLWIGFLGLLCHWNHCVVFLKFLNYQPVLTKWYLAHAVCFLLFFVYPSISTIKYIFALIFSFYAIFGNFFPLNCRVLGTRLS